MSHIVSIPDEDYPLCRLSLPELDSALFVLFPSPMRIVPCVDSVPDNPVQLCTPAPISKRPTSPQAAKKHSSTPKRESRVAIPHKRDDAALLPSFPDSIMLFSRYARRIPHRQNPVWMILLLRSNTYYS